MSILWYKFKMNKIGDYHDIFLKTDILLLADAFEKFIHTCLEQYVVDFFHYFSSPELSLDATAKMTGIERELISYIDIYLFIEKGMIGGTSYIGKDLVKPIINT